MYDDGGWNIIFGVSFGLDRCSWVDERLVVQVFSRILGNDQWMVIGIATSSSILWIIIWQRTEGHPPLVLICPAFSRLFCGQSPGPFIVTISLLTMKVDVYFNLVVDFLLIDEQTLAKKGIAQFGLLVGDRSWAVIWRNIDWANPHFDFKITDPAGSWLIFPRKISSPIEVVFVEDPAIIQNLWPLMAGLVNQVSEVVGSGSGKVRMVKRLVVSDFIGVCLVEGITSGCLHLVPQIKIYRLLI